MRYVIDQNWREMWDAIIVSAGKPNFYTDDGRPFREVTVEHGGRIEFTKVKLHVGSSIAFDDRGTFY